MAATACIRCIAYVLSVSSRTFKLASCSPAKRGIQYAHYPTLPEILSRFSKFMQQVGEADQTPARGAAAQQLARL